ncbi:TrmH family RNA methyltransferase [Oerskovia sp. M15]
MRPDDLTRIPVRQDFLGAVFDRPTQPGNIGSIIRSADAFGAHGVITTGHAADAYDPKAVRASTGSFFALPRCTRAPRTRSWTGSTTSVRRACRSWSRRPTRTGTPSSRPST